MSQQDTPIPADDDAEGHRLAPGHAAPDEGDDTEGHRLAPGHAAPDEGDPEGRR